LKQEYREAFEEVYQIINLMPNELRRKIPLKFYKMIEDDRDTNYKITIVEPIEKQVLKYETIIILGLIYRDFLCSPEEKQRLKDKDQKALKEAKEALEKEISEKNKIFNQVESQEDTSNQMMIVVEDNEKWYKKLFSLLKRVFKRK